MHHEKFNSATHPNENVLVLAVVRPVWDKTLKKEFSPKGMNKIQADSRTLPTLPLVAFV
jgi:hypothetical protein